MTPEPTSIDAFYDAVEDAVIRSQEEADERDAILTALDQINEVGVGEATFSESLRNRLKQFFALQEEREAEDEANAKRREGGLRSALIADENDPLQLARQQYIASMMTVARAEAQGLYRDLLQEDGKNQQGTEQQIRGTTEQEQMRSLYEQLMDPPQS